MKFPSVYTHICFEQVFENATPGRKIMLPLGCEQSELRDAASADCFFSSWFQGQVVWLAKPGSREGVYDNEINTHNSVTIENITNFYIKFLNKENLGNHPLQ